jgi:hypothetical protein
MITEGKRENYKFKIKTTPTEPGFSSHKTFLIVSPIKEKLYYWIMRLLQEETDDPGEALKIIAPILVFLVYFFIFGMVLLEFCLRCRKRVQQRAVVRALVQQARRDRGIHPDSSSPEEGYGIDVESLLVAMRKQIILEHFRSNGKQMVGAADSCMRTVFRERQFPLLTPRNDEESSQCSNEEDDEVNDVESGLGGGGSMLLIAEGESKNQYQSAAQYV